MSTYDPKHLTGYSVGTAAGRHYARRGRIDPDRGRRNRARAPQVVARLLFTRAARSAGPGWKLSHFCTRSSGLYLSQSNTHTSTNLAIGVLLLVSVRSDAPCDETSPTSSKDAWRTSRPAVRFWPKADSLTNHTSAGSPRSPVSTAATGHSCRPTNMTIALRNVCFSPKRSPCGVGGPLRKNSQTKVPNKCEVAHRPSNELHSN